MKIHNFFKNPHTIHHNNFHGIFPWNLSSKDLVQLTNERRTCQSVRVTGRSRFKKAWHAFDPVFSIFFCWTLRWYHIDLNIIYMYMYLYMYDIYIYINLWIHEVSMLNQLMNRTFFAHRSDRIGGDLVSPGEHNLQWSGRIRPAPVPRKRLTTPRWLYLGPKFYGTSWLQNRQVRWGDGCVDTWGGCILNLWRSRSTFPHFSVAERHAEHGEMQQFHSPRSSSKVI